MRHRYLRFQALLIVCAAGIILLFQNCGNNAQFGEAPLNSTETPDGSTVLKSVKVTIETSQAQSEVDIVWVVDNSPSMAEEADHIRRNVASFAAQVRQKTNLRLALISKAGSSGTSVSLPNDPDFLQVDQEVTSWDALLLAASALCGSGSQASATCQGIDAINGISPYNLEDAKKEIEDSKKIRGSLKDFLSRKMSKKVFVFVTDDNSSWSHTKFLAVAKENLDGQTPLVSSFVRLSSMQSPCGARNGTAYIDLAQKTSGSVFNICASDWSSTFAQLASDVDRVIERVIPLPAGIAGRDVVAVWRGGKPLAPGLFQVTDSTIRLSSTLNLNEGEIIQIVYQAAP